MTTQDRNERLLDADPRIQLRGTNEAALTTTAVGTPALVPRSSSYWDKEAILLPLRCAARFEVSAINTSGDATYALELLASLSAMMTSPVTLTSVLVTKVGSYLLTLDRDDLARRFPSGSVFIASRVTIGGSTGKSINFSARLVSL